MSALDVLADLLGVRSRERDALRSFESVDEIVDALPKMEEVRRVLPDEDADRPGGRASGALDGLADLQVDLQVPPADATGGAGDLFDCVDEIEDALHGAHGKHWEIRDEDAVLCASLPAGVRVEVVPVTPCRCEVRLRLDVARLRPLVGAIQRAMVVIDRVSLRA